MFFSPSHDDGNHVLAYPPPELFSSVLNRISQVKKKLKINKMPCKYLVAEPVFEREVELVLFLHGHGAVVLDLPDVAHALDVPGAAAHHVNADVLLQLLDVVLAAGPVEQIK